MPSNEVNYISERFAAIHWYMNDEHVDHQKWSDKNLAVGDVIRTHVLGYDNYWKVEKIVKLKDVYENVPFYQVHIRSLTLLIKLEEQMHDPLKKMDVTTDKKRTPMEMHLLGLLS